MALPQWSTPERRKRLVQLVTAYKGRCLKGHALCQDVEHYVHTFCKVEVASHPINVADVREGRAITPSSHGMGIVDLAMAVSQGPVVGPKRVEVQHEELSDRYGVLEEQVIESWKQDDREERSADGREWDFAQHKMSQQLHPTGEVGRFVQFSTGKSHRRPFDPIQRETFIANRPRYYILGYGVDGQLSRHATVRIPGTRFILNVDVSGTTKPLAQRQSKRLHQQGLKPRTEETLIQEAVAAWWAVK